MSSDDEARNALTTLGVGPAAKELYIDLLRPAATEMGESLRVVAKVVGHALSPLKALVWSMDKVHDWLAAELLRRLAKTAPDDIQPPPPYVAGQVLLQLPFCGDQERLRDLYANLLAAAMTKGRSGDVHPAFVHVIQQLTPDEALVLRQIVVEGTGIRLSELLDDSGLLLKKGSSFIADQFKDLCRRAGATVPDHSDAYLDNLLRLRVFDEVHWSQGRFHPPGPYLHGDHEGFVENSTERMLMLSSFGEKFLRTCVAAGDVSGR